MLIVQAKNPGLHNLVMIIPNYTSSDNDKLFAKAYYIVCIQRMHKIFSKT